MEITDMQMSVENTSFQGMNIQYKMANTNVFKNYSSKFVKLNSIVINTNTFWDIFTLPNTGIKS